MYSDKTRAASIGRIGEQKAADYLRTKGYFIVKRNWRDSRYGEIDIVAESKDNIVFAEVRTRRRDGLYSGAESVDVQKLIRVKNAAVQFMKRYKCSNLPYRVDVIELSYYNENEKEKWQLRHIKNV